MSAQEQQPESQVKQKRVKKTIPICGICVEPFNKSTRQPINCPYCIFEACKICCETYILNETTVKCMNPECSKPWNRKQIRERFTLVFINGTLREHYEKVLFDKERALLPATQPIVEAKIEAKNIQKQMDKIYKQMGQLRIEADELARKKSAILNRKSKALPRAFIRACPADDCRGFLSSQWKCGICEKWTCPECHIVKGYTRDADHTCNPDDVATAKLLASDTKPCPKCATGIFKIDGCDQMWCTQCHTAFSWRTGTIENNIHNPHYYEWARRNGGVHRNPQDVPCGRNLDHYLYDTFSRMIRGYYSKTPNFTTILSRIDKTIRWGIHMLNVERPRPLDYQNRNENLRVGYLMNEITEEEMRDILQRDDKRHHRNQELSDVYTLLVNTVTDILYRFLDQLEKTKTDYLNLTNPIDNAIFAEIDHIVEYANECLLDISHTYSSAKYVVENDLHIIKGQRAIEIIRNQKEDKKEDPQKLANTFV